MKTPKMVSIPAILLHEMERLAKNRHAVVAFKLASATSIDSCYSEDSLEILRKQEAAWASLHKDLETAAND